MDPQDEMTAPQSKHRAKWTFGSIFRRRSKKTAAGESSDSSSDNEKSNKNFILRRRSARKRKKEKVEFQLSNPWSGSANSLGSSECIDSHGSLQRKQRREFTKTKLEATRRKSSSDDEQPTTNDNGMCRYRSDESLSNKKTRSARTERYMKRLTRDDDSTISKSDVEINQHNIKLAPTWSATVKYRDSSPFVRAFSSTPSPHFQRRNLVQSAILQSSPGSVRRSYCDASTNMQHFYYPTNHFHNFKSNSYGNNINDASHENGLSVVYSKPYYQNLSQFNQPSQQQPPPPPPRDFQRRLLMNNLNHTKAQSEQNLPRVPTINAYSQHQPDPQFQYLTDKLPRSRKPIHVIPMQIGVANNQKCNSSSPERNKLSSPALPTDTHDIRATSADSRRNIKTPPPPPVRRYSSRQSSVTSLEEITDNRSALDSSPLPSKCSKDTEFSFISNHASSNSSNLEDALNELETIYQSLKLGDDDLLDRAERRDLPIAHQQLRNKPNSNCKAETLPAISDVPRRKNKAPPLRRSGMPDLVADDMAYRRLQNKNNNSLRDHTTGSYLLVSPALSPIPQFLSNNPADSEPEPDTTLDDMLYRSIKSANNNLKVMDPQPPFGIPINPSPATCTEKNYINIIPTDKYKSTFRPRKTPDVIKDDLAFRNLRREKLISKTLSVSSVDKRKRAVRSLSANLMNLMERHSNDGQLEKTQSLTSLPEAIQHLINSNTETLNATQKRPPPSWLERANLLDTSTETLTQSKANLRLSNYLSTEESRPNSLYFPKSSQQSNAPPSEAKLSEHRLEEDELEELLSELAKEAHQTSEQLGKELQKLCVGSHTIEDVSFQGKEHLKSPINNSTSKSGLSFTNNDARARLCLPNNLTNNISINDVKAHSRVPCGMKFDHIIAANTKNKENDSVADNLILTDDAEAKSVTPHTMHKPFKTENNDTSHNKIKTFNNQVIIASPRGSKSICHFTVNNECTPANVSIKDSDISSQPSTIKALPRSIYFSTGTNKTNEDYNNNCSAKLNSSTLLDKLVYGEIKTSVAAPKSITEKSITNNLSPVVNASSVSNQSDFEDALIDSSSFLREGNKHEIDISPLNNSTDISEDYGIDKNNLTRTESHEDWERSVQTVAAEYYVDLEPDRGYAGSTEFPRRKSVEYPSKLSTIIEEKLETEYSSNDDCVYTSNTAIIKSDIQITIDDYSVLTTIDLPLADLNDYEIYTESIVSTGSISPVNTLDNVTYDEDGKVTGKDDIMTMTQETFVEASPFQIEMSFNNCATTDNNNDIIVKNEIKCETNNEMAPRNLHKYLQSDANNLECDKTDLLKYVYSKDEIDSADNINPISLTKPIEPKSMLRKENHKSHKNDTSSKALNFNDVLDFTDKDLRTEVQAMNDIKARKEVSHKTRTNFDQEVCTELKGEILLADLGLENFQARLLSQNEVPQRRDSSVFINHRGTSNTSPCIDFDVLAFLGAVFALVSILTALSLAAR